MNRRTICLILSLNSLFVGGSFALDSQANSMLSLLGKDRNSSDLKSWKAALELDKQFGNSTKGVQLILNEFSGQVESIFLTSKNQGLAELPFGIRWNDDTAKLIQKLGMFTRTDSKNTMKFNFQNVGIEVVWSGSSSSVIQAIRFYQEVPKSELEKRMLEVKEDMMKKSRESEDKKPSTPLNGIGAPEIKMAKMDNRLSDFKKGILQVFKSYKESAFAAIKGQNRTSKNFWNYKYTYATDLRIPGEKYSMLYSFPFSNSQLDFVSVLKEGDELDAAFIKTYHDFEKKLMESFPAKEGWVASCIGNRESKALSDLEFRNEQYGSVVLDYCKSPKGKHVLYMRFLLYSN